MTSDQRQPFGDYSIQALGLDEPRGANLIKQGPEDDNECKNDTDSSDRLNPFSRKGFAKILLRPFSLNMDKLVTPHPEHPGS